MHINTVSFWNWTPDGMNIDTGIRYPFHLRPRNKQPFRYIRMAAEVIHELELDQETPVDLVYPNALATAQQLNKIRAYLGYFYLAST